MLSFSIDEPDRNFVFVSRFCLRPSSAAAPQNDTLHLQASFNETAEAPVLVLYSGDRDSTSYFGDVWGDDDNSPAACRRKVRDGDTFRVEGKGGMLRVGPGGACDR